MAGKVLLKCWTRVPVQEGARGPLKYAQDKQSLIVQAFYPPTQEAVAGGLQAQGPPGLQSGFKADPNNLVGVHLRIIEQ